MKLRTRLDVFSAALLSALGASQLGACGGTTIEEGSAGAGQSGGSSAGASSAGASSAGASTGGAIGVAGSSGAAQGGALLSAGSGGALPSAGSANAFPCKDPVDNGSGVITCDGFTHRPNTGACVSKLPRPEPVKSPSPNAQCEQDSDCTYKPNGWCGNSGGQLPGTFCNYGCVKDSECGADQLCECGDPVGRCVSADCTSDADCTPGFLCKGYDASGGCELTRYTCQTLADNCGSNADCLNSPGGNLCQFDTATKAFMCKFGGCAVGRPFLVEGCQRLASVATRADWRELALLPRLEGLDAALRAHLAEKWTRVALMEHASIAAFARFSLQLLSLGAPAELIEQATSAMADETRHAKACFAVASAYAGAPVGPGRLSVESSLDEMSLQAIVLNTIREGCVGETVAAVEAREAAEHAQDPALRELLLVISEDETRHAELAFRFVKWALSQGDAALERAVQSELDELTQGATSLGGTASALENAALQHGIVSEPLRRVIRAQAVREVIVPCARALYAPRAAQGTTLAAAC